MLHHGLDGGLGGAECGLIVSLFEGHRCIPRCWSCEVLSCPERSGEAGVFFFQRTTALIIIS